MATSFRLWTRLRGANFVAGSAPCAVNRFPSLFVNLSSARSARFSTHSPLSRSWLAQQQGPSLCPLSAHHQTRSLHTTQALFSRSRKAQQTKGQKSQTNNRTKKKREEDYYEVLKIEKTATEKEVRRSYLKLAKQNHPDHNPGNVEAEFTFKLITEAHAVLSDSKRRALYDKHGKEGFTEEESHRDGLVSMFGGDKFEEMVGDSGPIFDSGDTEEHADALTKVEEDEGMLKRKDRLLDALMDAECPDVRKKLRKELKDLKMAIRKDYIERSTVAAAIDEERIQKKLKESDDQIESLVESLLFRLSVYQPNASMIAHGTPSFEEQTKKRASEIVQSTGGIGMLEMVGDMYLLEARRNFTFGEDFLGLDRAKAYGTAISIKVSSAVGMLKRGYQLSKLKDKIMEDEKGGKDLAELNQGAVVELLWMHGKYHFSGRIQQTLRKVLLDKAIDPEEKKRRAEGIRIMGKIFLEVAEETKKNTQFTESPLNWQSTAKNAPRD